MFERSGETLISDFQGHIPEKFYLATFFIPVVPPAECTVCAF